MIVFEQGELLDINLQEDNQGRDHVVLDLKDTCTLSLSPHQARVLATELIMAVNRAEVRNNLRRSTSLTRRNGTETPRDSLNGHVFAR